MPLIQISQIILRSGPESDLPGAPTSLNPLTFSNGLEVGEMAFMTDTGRVFVGHNPLTGQPQYNRATFPYRNIEVLTENSTGTLARVVGSAIRDLGNDAFYEARLPRHDNDWASVVVPRQGDENYVYRIPLSESVSATIDYTVWDSQMRPLKIGTLTVMYGVGEAEPFCDDDATVLRRSDQLDPEVFVGALAYGQVEFTFTVAGPLGARYLAFQYKNLTTDVLSMKFKTSIPKAQYYEPVPSGPNL
jgi:hypothetical protein